MVEPNRVIRHHALLMAPARGNMVEAKDYIKTIRPYKPGKPIEELIRELNLKCEVIKLTSNVKFESPGVDPEDFARTIIDAK